MTIRDMLITRNPLVVNPALAEELGLNKAIALQQVQYWIGIKEQRPNENKDYFIKGQYWIHNTIEEWKEQFPFWSESTIARTFRQLKEDGLLLVEKLSKDSWDKTNWYSINYSYKTSKATEKQSLTPSGHIDTIEEIKMASSTSGHIDTIEEIKMASSLYSTETTTETTQRVQDVMFRKFISKLKSEVPNEYKLKIKDISFDRARTTLEEIENNNLAYTAFKKITKSESIDDVIEIYISHIEAEKKNQNGRFIKNLINFLMSYETIKASLKQQDILKPLAVEYLNGLIEDYETGKDLSWMNIKDIENKYQVIGKPMLDAELKRRGVA